MENSVEDIYARLGDLAIEVGEYEKAMEYYEKSGKFMIAHAIYKLKERGKIKEIVKILRQKKDNGFENLISDKDWIDLGKQFYVRKYYEDSVYAFKQSLIFSKFLENPIEMKQLLSENFNFVYSLYLRLFAKSLYKIGKKNGAKKLMKIIKEIERELKIKNKKHYTIYRVFRFFYRQP